MAAKAVDDIDREHAVIAAAVYNAPAYNLSPEHTAA
jgi:hypothetical protein